MKSNTSQRLLFSAMAIMLTCILSCNKPATYTVVHETPFNEYLL